MPKVRVYTEAYSKLPSSTTKTAQFIAKLDIRLRFKFKMKNHTSVNDMDSDTPPIEGQGGIMPVASHTPSRPHPNAISQAYSPAGSHQESPLRPAREQQSW